MCGVIRMKLFNSAAVLLASLAFASPAQAQAVFSCTIAKNQKVLQLADTAGQVVYAYGKKGAAPELEIAVAREDAELYAWEGFGRYHTHSVALPRGEYRYTVYTSLDSLTGETTAGVTVERGDKLLADLPCNMATVNGDLEGYVLGLKGADVQSGR